MAVAKVIEITSVSEQGFEDAIRRGIATAAETLQDIQGAWVKEQNVRVADGKVNEFRVTMKVTFLLRGSDDAGRGGETSGRGETGGGETGRGGESSGRRGGAKPRR